VTTTAVQRGIFFEFFFSGQLPSRCRWKTPPPDAAPSDEWIASGAAAAVAGAAKLMEPGLVYWSVFERFNRAAEAG